MQSSTKLNKNVKVIIKKKNIPSNMQFRGKKVGESMNDSGHKKVEGFSDYFSMNNDPKFQEMMNKYENDSWGNGNSNSFGTNNVYVFSNGQGSDDFKSFFTSDEVWGNN